LMSAHAVELINRKKNRSDDIFFVMNVILSNDNRLILSNGFYRDLVLSLLVNNKKNQCCPVKIMWFNVI
jgi:hypothetical protein